MKTLVLANQKGGVGKTFCACQLAYYWSILLKQRVLVIDLDHQGNTMKVLRTGGLVSISSIAGSQVLAAKVNTIEGEPFVLVPSDDTELLKLEKQPALHNQFATNLQSFLNTVGDKFDLCIIDTNPNPDIRQLAALVVSNFVLSPIQLNQEAIDGIGRLLNHETIGIRKIQAVLNSDMRLIGILPNMVEPTPFQRDNLRDLCAHFAKLLIPLNAGFAAIKKTTAIPEAQAQGLPIWHLSKTSARIAWAQIKPVFEKITSIME